MNRACIRCGELNDGKDYCPDCRPKRVTKPKASATARGYGYQWEKLSRRARELQPFCTDCLEPGTRDNPLTVDHSKAAWDKANSGKSLTLKDFTNGLLNVRCLRCNIAAGNARGTKVNRTATTKTPA